jgi:cytochrome oxidase maturation protein, cbb3-type
MSVVYILVFVAIFMAGGFLVAFIWSVKNGQYEDTYTPSVRILFDDLPVNNDQEEQKVEKGNGKPENKESGVIQSQLADNSQPEIDNSKLVTKKQN